jgi:prevent-host-death family protein
MVKTLSLSQARAKLSRLVEDIEQHGEEVVITRNSRPAAVLMSADKYHSWKKTHAVRSDKALMMTEIRAGLRQLKARKARLYTLEELFS